MSRDDLYEDNHEIIRTASFLCSKFEDVSIGPGLPSLVNLESGDVAKNSYPSFRVSGPMQIAKDLHLYYVSLEIMS